MSYAAFLDAKLRAAPPSGMADVPPLGGHLFPFQADLVRWALRRGRAATFCDTGLGKTRIQLEWARQVHVATGGRILILAPLAVAAQTVAEGECIGVPVKLCRTATDVADGVNVTNYDRLHRFDASQFVGVVLDESSCIKHHDAKTLRTLLDAFAHTPWKLCCTATPAPNDWTELGTHAEFLGICSRSEMLSEFFIHDGGDTQTWRLKGHARVPFWRWVSSWGALVRKPSDLGYSDEGFILPPLTVTQHEIKADVAQAHKAGMLFVDEAKTLMDRRRARKASLGDRVAACVEVVKPDVSEQWVVWCELNDEQNALARELGSECVSIYGSLQPDEKQRLHAKWIAGDARVIVSKPSIFGFGLNWQHCSRMAFVGVTDSWESYYQAVRRVWRFGQQRPVDVHVFSSEAEGAVVANLLRKERDAIAMAESLSRETRDIVRGAVRSLSRESNVYAANAAVKVPEWMRSEDE